MNKVEMQDVFLAYFKQLVKEVGYEGAAKAADCSVSMISHLMAGRPRRRVGLEHIQKIAEAKGLSTGQALKELALIATALEIGDSSRPSSRD